MFYHYRIVPCPTPMITTTTTIHAPNHPTDGHGRPSCCAACSAFLPQAIQHIVRHRYLRPEKCPYLHAGVDLSFARFVGFVPPACPCHVCRAGGGGAFCHACQAFHTCPRRWGLKFVPDSCVKGCRC